MGAFSSLEPDEPHTIVAAVAVRPGHYRVECSCGWLSDVHTDAQVMMASWETHVT
jgi:hypothetical protein